MPDPSSPIGVFDSGIGGLTVLAALRRRLPGEHLLYLGDTARVPYGTRSPATVERYSLRVAGHLVRRGVKALVVACNTASTWALGPLRAALEPRGIPVLGVIEPGARLAAAQSPTGRVGVIGTEGTVRGGVYPRTLAALRPGLVVQAVPCPLFVALAEEGWTDGEVARLTAEAYLAPLRGQIDTLILGCTHYPLLRGPIAAALPGVQLIDSAVAVAEATALRIAEAGLARTDAAGPGAAGYLVTDNPERFQAVGARFLHEAPPLPTVVDLTPDDDAALEGT